MEELGFEADDSLESLFGDQVADLDSLVDRTTAVVDLLVPRRTMLAGDRLLEGLVIGLAAADDSAKLGVADVLGRRADDGDDDDEVWQQLGYRWAYDEMSLVTERSEDRPAVMPKVARPSPQSENDEEVISTLTRPLTVPWMLLAEVPTRNEAETSM